MIERTKHKVLQLSIKYIPPLTALLYFANSVMTMFDCYFFVLSFIDSCGFLSLLLMYTTCDALKFCKHHKAYIVYILVNNMVNMYDYAYDLGSDNIRWIFVLGTFFILLCYLTYRHLKK